MEVSLWANVRCAPPESLGGDETGKSTDWHPWQPVSARRTARGQYLRMRSSFRSIVPRGSSLIGCTSLFYLTSRKLARAPGSSDTMGEMSSEFVTAAGLRLETRWIGP